MDATQQADNNDDQMGGGGKSKEQETLVAEANTIASFLKVVNDEIRGNGTENPMSERTALKFLISRKFDIQRALQLYQMHEITRLRENLNEIDPNEANLKAELESGKFTILKHRDANDSAIAVFTAKLHAPNKSSKDQALRRMTHQTTLQGIVYQLDSALDDIITQRNGIVFIYNMSNSEYSNFDYELCQKILYLLKGAYPAKLKKVLIVSPPLWFRAPFHLLRLIVREKLRDRVWLLSINQLPDHVPKNVLTPELGGTYQHDHQAWIEECNNLYKTRYNDLCDPTSAQTLVDSLKEKKNNSNSNIKSSLSNFRRLSNELLTGIESPQSLLGSNYQMNETSRLVDGKKRIKTLAHDYDDPPGMSLSQLVQFVRSRGFKGLTEEYSSMEMCSNSGTFLVSSSPMNMMKNRYINVKCYDHSRVVLEPYDLPSGTTPDDPMDYINASYVDGYRQPKAYVSTQGPMRQTLTDFWRMIWQTGSRVIVMVTLNIEGEILKCDKYWPSPGDRTMEFGVYTVDYINIEIHEDFITTQLKLTNTRSEVSRDIWHMQFRSWPDFGTPETSNAILKYRDSVLKKQLDAIEITGGAAYPPIVVHCSAGIGRSGTFVTIDICIQKLETTGLVDVKSVVEKLRQQRYNSIQTKDQYIFCYKSIIDYAASCGLLSGEDLEDLFSDTSRQ